MGGRPLHALVTVAGPLGDVDVDALYDGLLAAAEVFGCPVVGGDLAAAPVLVVSVAVTGTLDGRAAGAAVGRVAGRPHVRHRSPRLSRRASSCCAPGGGARRPTWRWPTAGRARAWPRARRRAPRVRPP